MGTIGEVADVVREPLLKHVEKLEAELAARPTQWAYEAACKALVHWRTEAKRLGKLAGVTPREMKPVE